MSLTVFTQDPQDLLNAIKKSINDGNVETWEYDKNGDFVHKPEQ